MEADASFVSWIQTLPPRSHTYMRPLVSKVMPTASLQPPSTGPEMIVSVNPAGRFAARAELNLIARKHTVTSNVIATGINLRLSVQHVRVIILRDIAQTMGQGSW